MPVEFISSTNFGPSTGVKYSGFDPEYARRYVRMLDDGGFEWTLVGYDSQRVDSVTRAQFILNNSERMRPVVAHRPGFQFPTQFAKALAGLDRIGGGRLATHIIAGGSDEEMHREGDYTTKEQRYRRAEEFIEIVRQISVRPGYEIWPSVASCTTARSGRRWPRRSAGRVRPRPWLAPTRRSPRRSSITRRSAAICCRSAAGTCLRMRRITRATCSRWCARNWLAARRTAPRRSSTRTPRRSWSVMLVRNGR